VEQLTWVPAETIRELARAIGDAGGVSILMYTGLEYSNSGVQAIRAALTLQAVSGNVDVPGGKLFRSPDRPRLNRLLTAAPEGPPPLWAEECPLFYAARNEADAALLPRAILEGEPYPVRILIVSGGGLEGRGVTRDGLGDARAGAGALAQPPRRFRKYASGELRAAGEPGFETPSGKFEIASEWFREHGYEPLPVYTEPSEGPLASPEIAEEFPLVFNSGARIKADFRTQHHNIPGLVRLQPEPLVHLHADDAEVRGIAEGDLVEVV